MKLSARDARSWIAKPPADRPGTLIYGQDAMRVALKRQDLVANLAGPGAEEEMRLTRVSGAELRKEKALLADAQKAQGFFPGPRVVLLEDATAHVADTVVAALSDWLPGDAHMVVTAGSLKPSSPLRKAFEKHPQAACIAVYDDAAGPEEISGWLAEARVAADRDAMAALLALAQQVGPGDLRQVIEKLALYMRGEDGPASSEDVRACAPASTEADLDDVIHAAAEGRTDEIKATLTRLESQGAQPVAILIAAQRHFRQLHTVVWDPEGPGAGLGRLRPPVFGPRRDRMMRQAQRLGRHRTEDALGLLLDADMTLRSPAPVPQRPLVERTLIRLSLLGER
ncbi:DNA polymerase III subunit delta [Palleronia caenipelagi]|uniref:DNA-directed DNA polymerase n=1 Tax=Palleronia caenipelagi TaxID=2489174 RepID=A0A547Q0A1_9RHOB|nr:DNA polymerase III subunit delta [Palleronia caenipelagi]TRD19832.1 DNA polymerase III subunit delta [Palleronia caenipelagi]